MEFFHQDPRINTTEETSHPPRAKDTLMSFKIIIYLSTLRHRIDIRKAFNAELLPKIQFSGAGAVFVAWRLRPSFEIVQNRRYAHLTQPPLTVGRLCQRDLGRRWLRYLQAGRRINQHAGRRYASSPI
jgi:hypothetical protein